VTHAVRTTPRHRRIGAAACENFGRVGLDGDAVAAVGRRAEEARRDFADPPEAANSRNCGSGNQVRLSSAELWMRS